MSINSYELDFLRRVPCLCLARGSVQCSGGAAGSGSGDGSSGSDGSGSGDGSAGSSGSDGSSGSGSSAGSSGSDGTVLSGLSSMLTEARNLQLSLDRRSQVCPV